MDFFDPIEPIPSISRAKQARIDIWRNEVAILTIPDVARPGSPSSRSSATSPPSTSASSPSHSSSSIFSRPANREESRTRRIWRRLSRKLSGGGRQEDGSPGGAQAKNGEDAIVRTQMYRDERVDKVTDGRLQGNDDLAVPEESSEGNARGGLKEKQERLERAARLLHQGPAPNA